MPSNNDQKAIDGKLRNKGALKPDEQLTPDEVSKSVDLVQATNKQERPVDSTQPHFGAGFSYANPKYRVDRGRHHSYDVEEYSEFTGWIDAAGKETKKSDYSPEEWERISMEFLNSLKASQHHKP